MFIFGNINKFIYLLKNIESMIYNSCIIEAKGVQNQTRPIKNRKMRQPKSKTVKNRKKRFNLDVFESLFQ